MTTMLRSAAMTLLSKTLLTFLYKYLSDVDVEGIEMPSLYGSAEGPGSGWGVRLSNVKLREGAELKTLPGINKKGSNQRPPKEKEKDKPPIPKGEKANDNIIISRSPPEPDSSVSDSRVKARVEDSINGYAKVNQLSPDQSANRTSESDNNTVPPLPDMAGAITDGLGAERKRLYSEDTIYDDEDSLSSLPDRGTPRPETPTQDSSMSFLSCFAPGSEDAKKQAIIKGKRTELIEEMKEVKRQQQQEEDWNEKVGINPQMNGSDPKSSRAPPENGHFQPSSSEGEGFDHMKRRLDDNDGSKTKKDFDGDQEALEGDEDESDSQPMILRIGKGGYIGTLDVR